MVDAVAVAVQVHLRGVEPLPRVELLVAAARQAQLRRQVVAAAEPLVIRSAGPQFVGKARIRRSSQGLQKSTWPRAKSHGCSKVAPQAMVRPWSQPATLCSGEISHGISVLSMQTAERFSGRPCCQAAFKTARSLTPLMASNTLPC